MRPVRRRGRTIVTLLQILHEEQRPLAGLSGMETQMEGTGTLLRERGAFSVIHGGTWAFVRETNVTEEQSRENPCPA